jgi:DNA-binding IclR family transcriptional regulator
MNLREAAKFWGLDLATCWRVLTELRVIGVVSRDSDCRYHALHGVRS